jgi:hypothetical protein
MLHKKIIAVYCENYIEHIYTLGNMRRLLISEPAVYVIQLCLKKVDAMFTK